LTQLIVSFLKNSFSGALAGVWNAGMKVRGRSFNAKKEGMYLFAILYINKLF